MNLEVKVQAMQQLTISSEEYIHRSIGIELV